jgi:hypothetical protein
VRHVHGLGASLWAGVEGARSSTLDRCISSFRENTVESYISTEKGDGANEICRSKVKNSFHVVIIIIMIVIIIVFIILISISLFPLRGVKPGNDNFHLFQRWLCKYCRHATRGIT